MMLMHHLHLAWRSVRAAKGLSLLMALALGLGVGACMTTLTVYHVLAADPIPTKSSRLFDVQLDAANLEGYKAGDEPTFQLSRFDAEALLREKRGQRQVMMSGGAVTIYPDTGKTFVADARFTSSDFFAMFEAPIAQGSAWNAQADQDSARVAVISHALKQRLFGDTNAVGRELNLRGLSVQVVAVMAPWRVPHYFDLTMLDYDKHADLYLPFGTALQARLGSAGSMTCWDSVGAAGSRDLNAPCAWIQYWVELAHAGDAAAYKDYLVTYSEAQRAAGRFQRPPNVRLRNVNQHLLHSEVVPGDVRLQVWLAFGFLLVCLVNTVGLQLAKSLKRAGEIGIRRALGATRGTIFQQFLVEAAALGAAGGLLGLLLALLGLWLVRSGPTPYAQLAQMDLRMLATTLALALLASLLAGVLPAWMATRVMPAQHLKTQ